MEGIERKVLSSLEYLEILQLEYFTHRVREIIFDKPAFVKMHGDIAKMKKDKIIDLSIRSHKRNMFESLYVFQNFWSDRFLNKTGLPNFQYSIDSKKKEVQIYYDRKYMFKTGTIVYYDDFEYIVKSNDIENEKISIALGDEIYIVSYSDVIIKNLVTFFDGKMI